MKKTTKKVNFEGIQHMVKQPQTRQPSPKNYKLGTSKTRRELSPNNVSTKITESSQQIRPSKVYDYVNQKLRNQKSQVGLKVSSSGLSSTQNLFKSKKNSQPDLTTYPLKRGSMISLFSKQQTSNNDISIQSIPFSHEQNSSNSNSFLNSQKLPIIDLSIIQQQYNQQRKRSTPGLAPSLDSGSVQQKDPIDRSESESESENIECDEEAEENIYITKAVGMEDIPNEISSTEDRQVFRNNIQKAAKLKQRESLIMSPGQQLKLSKYSSKRVNILSPSTSRGSYFKSFQELIENSDNACQKMVEVKEGMTQKLNSQRNILQYSNDEIFKVNKANADLIRQIEGEKGKQNVMKEQIDLITEQIDKIYDMQEDKITQYKREFLGQSDSKRQIQKNSLSNKQQKENNTQSQNQIKNLEQRIKEKERMIEQLQKEVDGYLKKDETILKALGDTMKESFLKSFGSVLISPNKKTSSLNSTSKKKLI